MTFNENAKLKKKRVTWKRSMVTIAGIAALVGGSNLVECTTQSAPSTNTVVAEDPCDTGDEANASLDCRIEFTTASLDLVWENVLKDQKRKVYTPPAINVFSDKITTACGVGETANGPFYCSHDQTVYIDTVFYKTLEDNFGSSNGPLAQEYVIAHEFGHHIQKTMGVLQRSFIGPAGPESNSVKAELQADCYAGVWATKADELLTEDGVAFLNPITDKDIADAIQTAGSIGDDEIAEKFGQEVRPERFTHGTADQRQKWFMAGYNSGNMNSCDTWKSPDLNNP